MKIDTISYLIRKNKGNYEHDEAMATAKVEDNELPANAFAQLKALVQHALNGECVVLANDEQPTIPETSHEEDAQPEAPKVEEAPKRQRRERAKVETTEKGGTTEPAKSDAKDSIVYNPSIKKHKDTLAETLDTNFAGWDSDENLPKAKAAAEKMANKPFLDAKTGVVLESFLTAFNVLYVGSGEKSNKNAL